MPYRPQEVAQRLGIAPVTLRVWSNEFAAFLSDSARRTVASNGRSAQRRYSDEDIALLQRAKALLAVKSTYDEVRRELLYASAESVTEGTDLAVVAENAGYLAHLKNLFDEALAAKDEALAGRDATIAAKDETIQEQREHVQTLQRQIERLEQRIVEVERSMPAPGQAPSPRPWWKRLLGQ